MQFPHALWLAQIQGHRPSLILGTFRTGGAPRLFFFLLLQLIYIVLPTSPIEIRCMNLPPPLFVADVLRVMRCAGSARLIATPRLPPSDIPRLQQTALPSDPRIAFLGWLWTEKASRPTTGLRDLVDVDPTPEGQVSDGVSAADFHGSK